MSSNGHQEITEKNLYRIGEVSRITDTKPFVLRYWETEFPMLQPVKSPKGHRLYRRKDVDTVLLISGFCMTKALPSRVRGVICGTSAKIRRQRRLPALPSR